jgi:hypothetical protein
VDVLWKSYSTQTNHAPQIDFKMTEVNKWDKVIHDFGKQPEGTKVETKFTYTGEREIEKVVPSCGCTTGKREGNTLSIIFNINRIPSHKRNDVDVFPTMRRIYVHFKDGHKDELKVKAQITKV